MATRRQLLNCHTLQRTPRTPEHKARHAEAQKAAAVGDRPTTSGGGGRDDNWGPDNNDDGRQDQTPSMPVPAAPPVPTEYYLDVMHMASKSRSTPWDLPRHHVHETSDTTNEHHAASTTTFGDLMQYYGMAPGRCNAIAYASGQIKHSLYDIAPGSPISRLAPSGTVLVIWDNASRPEDMATTLWCGESREHGPRATVAVEYQLAACDATEPPMRNTIGTVKIGSLVDGRFTNSNLQYICNKVEQ